MRLLIAVDGSSATGGQLDWLCTNGWLAGQHELVALHVVPALKAWAARSMTPDALEDYYAAEARPVWHLVRGYLNRHLVRAVYRHSVGDPAPCIAHIAHDEHFDLVVMGSHGHGAVASCLLGSVVSKVLAVCETAVLIVR